MADDVFEVHDGRYVGIRIAGLGHGNQFCVTTSLEGSARYQCHSWGTTTAAKKGGDNLGFNGHKHLKGDKVVDFCAQLRCACGVRHCNAIAPFIAPGNRNESLLLKEALSQVNRIAQQVGLDLNQTIVSLDGVYDS